MASVSSTRVWSCRPPGVMCLWCGWSDVALLRRLLVTRIEEGVRDHGDQKHHALDEVLAGIGDVHDSHAVEHGPDQQRSDHDIEHAAAAARQPDAAEDD